VWGRSATDVYVTGCSKMPDQAQLRHCDGGSWSDVDVGAEFYLFTGVWGDDQGRLFVVGDNGLLLRYDP
jgi:photosystem II stability/assembly factor-like uncharacterized protein